MPVPPFSPAIPTTNHTHAHTHTQLSKAERYRDLLAISVVHTLNAALCEFHTHHCPPSEQLRRECGRVDALYQATKAAVRVLDVELSCTDQFVS